MEINQNPPNPLNNIPDILFKYKPINEFTIKMLEEQSIYLPSPDQFNDPFDCALPFRYKQADLTPENVFLKLQKLGREMWPGMSEQELHKRCFERQNNGGFETGEYWKNEHEHTLREFNNKFGVLSLTSNPNHQLMWSHYADSHKGICMGFDKFGLYDALQGTLGPVIYSDEFPTLGIFDESEQYFIELLFTKSTIWEYENEYRIAKIDGSRETFNFHINALREIYLGAKIPENDADKILGIIRNGFPHVKCYQMKTSWENYEFIQIPILK